MAQKKGAAQWYLTKIIKHEHTDGIAKLKIPGWVIVLGTLHLVSSTCHDSLTASYVSVF